MKDIDKLCKLSNLLPPENKSDFEKQLDNIMTMITKIEEVDCSNIAPLTSVISETHFRLREDKVDQVSNVQDILSNIEGSNADISRNIGYFSVPKVVE